MKLWVTRLFPDAKVLVLLASLCFVLSCGKSQAVSGKSEADSNSNKSQPDNRNSDAPISDRDAVVGQKNADDKASPSASPTTSATPPAEKGPTYASRSVKDDEVVAMARRVRAAMPKDTDSQSLDLVSDAYSSDLIRSFEPAELIARASEMVNSAPTATLGDSGVDKSRYQQAANLAEQGIAMLKVQPEPSESAAKAEYRATLLEGLSVRAEALGVLAANSDRSQGRAAETAYREYLAAESNVGKKTRAEHRFASMLVALGELDKARTTYEGLLARNGEDTQALGGLVMVHRKIAVAQKAAGKEAAATINTELSASYAERLNKLSSEPAATTAAAESAGETRESDTRRVDREYKAVERLEPAAKRLNMRVPEQTSPARPRTDEVDRGQKARRRPGE